jgi:hypothetical protein
MSRPQSISPAEFMASRVPVAAPTPLSGNTEWAARYAAEIRRVFHNQAANAARSLQVHLGPSEIGHVCHRQVAGKLAGLPRLNHVTDPWPSIRGTALHAWAETAFTDENLRLGRIRWVPERKVDPFEGATPFETHRGTADLYDADEQSVNDHKFLGKTTMDKIRREEWPRHYLVQLLLYGMGYMRLGLPVKRVVLLAYPATEASLDGLYVLDHPITTADFELIEQVKAELDYRKKWAAALLTGAAQLTDVPADTKDECHWCPLYRPQTAHDNGPGCPGDARRT